MRRARRRHVTTGFLGDVVERFWGPPDAGAQIVGCGCHRPRIKEQLVAVPLGNCCRQPPVRRCKSDDSSNGLCRCNRACRPRLLAFESHLAADTACTVECVKRVVEIPAGAIVAKPA